MSVYIEVSSGFGGLFCFGVFHFGLALVFFGFVGGFFAYCWFCSQR